MNYRDLLASLLPPVAYDANQVKLDAELTAEGNALSLISSSADEVTGAVTPLFSDGLLNDWERVLELTPGEEDTWQQRLDAVLIKLAETGGLSRAYFIKLAATAGYTITIDEFEPFRAGINRAGDQLYVPEIIYVWAVNVKSSVTVYYFRAGASLPGERLATYGNKVLETIFENLKPAHTYCYFTYEEEV
ncbi:YmfQ family protein [Pantoea stewartii]|uniref:YmfQ family protein n=1 Tax=Pantoea stewartii TaxID=66269 RepID=UPI00336760A1